MPYNQITRSQLRVLLEGRLGNAATIFWRVDEKNKIIQGGMRLFNLLTGFWKGRTTITTVANQVWYALPSAIISSLRVSWQSKPLLSSSLFDLDFGRSAWESETTASGADVPSQPQVFAIGGLNLIALWPADAVGNTTMIVDGIAATPLLTTDGQFVDIGQEELKGLLDCCQMLAVFKEGGKEFTSSVEVFKQFLKAAGERNAILRASATWKKFMGLDTSRFKRPFKQAQERQGAR